MSLNPLQFLLLALSILFSFVTAMPTANLTIDHASSLRATKRVECVDTASWTTPTFVKEDCYVAVQDVYKWDYRWRPDEVITFFSGSAARHAVLSVHTPRRYVESSCTLALVTLNTFSAYALPGHLPHGVQPVEKATYREVYQAARALEEQCVARSGYPGKVGWAVVGSRMSLGVFLWATDSTMNYDVRNELLALTMGGNGSLTTGVA